MRYLLYLKLQSFPDGLAFGLRMNEALVYSLSSPIGCRLRLLPSAGQPRNESQRVGRGSRLLGVHHLQGHQRSAAFGPADRRRPASDADQQKPSVPVGFQRFGVNFPGHDEDGRPLLEERPSFRRRHTHSGQRLAEGNRRKRQFDRRAQNAIGSRRRVSEGMLESKLIYVCMYVCSKES